MKGRTPKPGELREQQGNPGHRAIVTAAPDEGPTGERLPFAELSEDARRAYDIIAADLRRMNFVRASDTSLLLRYCDTVARYWKVTKALDKFGDETYEVKTVSGDVMQRMRPQFMVQERLAVRLLAMEDRLGLSPMSRQQYMVRMAAVGIQPGLPGLPLDHEPDENDERSAKGSAVGFLRRGENAQRLN